MATVVAFTVAYAVAAHLGRQTVVRGTGVSLVWPAAGVSLLWLVARARRPWPWVDVVAIFVSTFAVVAATGSPLDQSALGATAATVQAVVCRAVVARRCPRLWASRGTRALSNGELWWFVLAATGSSVVSAPLASLAVMVLTGTWSWDVILLWCARNTASIIAVGTLGFVIADAAGRRWRRAGSVQLRTAGPVHRRAEWTTALVASPIVYLVWLIGFDDIALVFPLVVLTVWAGTRLPSAWVVVHNTTAVVVVTTATLAGFGPFVNLPDATTQVAVAQLYVGVVCILGLALGLSGDERTHLLVDLAHARDHAESQASLLTTIVDTLAEGIRVVDPTGRVLVRNPAATQLLLGSARLNGDGDGDDLHGVSRLDGSPLPADELPFRRALAGQEVRDLDLLVRVPGARDARTVSFTCARLPDTSGGGVVTVLRDVTAERQELARAARIQASLLPQRTPHLPGYQLAARFAPAGSVGGDFYDWHSVDDGLVLTLADVMGKGPGAGILAASTRSLLQAHADDADVAATLVAAEHAMTPDLVAAGAFVTVMQARLNAPRGAVTYADAGHGLSFVVKHHGSSYRLPATGLPFGIVPDQPRTSSTVTLDPGDTFLVVSDGVLDAVGGSVAELRRFELSLQSGTSADAVADSVLDLAQRSGVQDDDLTIVALRRTAAGG